MQEVKIDAFGHVCPPPCVQGNDDGLLKRYKLKVDKLGNTKVVEDEPLNLYKEIQSFKDKCGMVAARKLIKNGLVSSRAYADHAQDFGDVSIEQYDLPEISESAHASAVAFEKLGIKDQASLDAYINNRVAELLAQREKAEVKQDAK